jgi:hypothetical protein
MSSFKGKINKAAAIRSDGTEWQLTKDMQLRTSTKDPLTYKKYKKGHEKEDKAVRCVTSRKGA